MKAVRLPRSLRVLCVLAVEQLQRAARKHVARVLVTEQVEADGTQIDVIAAAGDASITSIAFVVVALGSKRAIVYISSDHGAVPATLCCRAAAAAAAAAVADGCIAEECTHTHI